ncbi:hypothetical protein DMENIID0001_114920 [Sergentomyia squamirostris]
MSLIMSLRNGLNKVHTQQKDSPFEGGVRVPTVIWSPLLAIRRGISDVLIHTSDWLPTFAHLAGLPFTSFNNIDGINVWEALTKNITSPRHEVLHNIDSISGYSSFTRDGWKYVNGSRWDGRYDSWYGHPSNASGISTETYTEMILNSSVWRILNSFDNSNLNTDDVLRIRSQASIKCNTDSLPSVPCFPLLKPCLFNTDRDPCELANMADAEPERVLSLRQAVDELSVSMLPPINVKGDPQCDPAQFGGIWTWWLDEIEAREANDDSEILFWILVALVILLSSIIGFSIIKWCLKRRFCFSQEKF